MEMLSGQQPAATFRPNIRQTETWISTYIKEDPMQDFAKGIPLSDFYSRYHIPVLWCAL